MTPELHDLIIRVVKADGPLVYYRLSGKDYYGYRDHDPDHYQFTHAYDEWDTMWASTMFMRLIMDAQQRNHAVLVTQGAVTLRRSDGQTDPNDYKVLIWPRDTPSGTYEAAEHADLLTAGCKAWLDNFE